MTANRQREAGEQAALFQWAKLNERKYPVLRFLFAIPNGGSRRDAIEGAHLKAQGVRAGVPDIFLPVPSGEYAGLFLESKAKGGRLRPNQKEWIAGLTEQGYRALCVFGFDEARDAIEEYLRGA